MPIMAHKTGDAVRIQGEIGDDFDLLVKEYYATISRLAFSILDDAHEADDAAQDAFIAAYHNLDSYRGDASVRTWLSAIVINVCRGRLRKRKTQTNLRAVLWFLKNQTPPVSPEQAALKNEADSEIWQAVNALDEKHRLVVMLHYVHEMSVPEIATILDIKQGTVYSRLHYARRRLQGVLVANPPRAEVRDGTS